MNESSRTSTLAAGGPTIVCPSWCVVPYAEHLEDLPNWDGFALHRGREHRLAPVLAPDAVAQTASMTYIDGTPGPDRDHAPTVGLWGRAIRFDGSQYTPDQAEDLARSFQEAVLKAVEEARA